MEMMMRKKKEVIAYYYKKMLFQFAVGLILKDNARGTSEVLKGKIESELEEIILNFRREERDEDFFYLAGRSAQAILNTSVMENNFSLALESAEKFEVFVKNIGK